MILYDCRNRSSIKASLLPSKSTTRSKVYYLTTFKRISNTYLLLQASGACSQLQAPTSRLAKPTAKSIPNPSTRTGLSKPPELKQPTSRLATTTMGASRSSRLATKTSRETTLKQPTGAPGQPRSKMAAPSAALRKKVVGGMATENPSRRRPMTASAPISSRCVCIVLHVNVLIGAEYREPTPPEVFYEVWRCGN